jgi:branched-chain amino acid transport system substrate-binding protein
MPRPRLLPVIVAMAILAMNSRVYAEILIATAGPMTGTNAAFGEQLKRGAQQAVDDINASGGFRGERLVLVVGDDGCDPQKAVEVATAFVAQAVKFVAGHYCSGSSIPAAKVYEAAGILQISPASTNPKFTDDGGWNVLRVCARDDAQGTIAGKYIATHFAGKRVAILSDKSPSSVALAARVRQTLKAANVAVFLDETYDAGAKDYGDLAQKLFSGEIDVVYTGGSYPEAGLIIRELRSLGSQAQLIGGDNLVNDGFASIARDSSDGTIMTFAADPLGFDSATSLVQRFTDQGYNPEGATLYAYAAVQAFVQAAEATGGTDSHRMAQWLRGGNRISTVVGPITFDAKGDVTAPHFEWFRWSGGHYGEAPDIQ